MLLTGVFGRSIDEKLRVAIPKRLREALAEVVYIAPGTDQSLVLYTEEAFGGLAERLAQVSPARQDVRAFKRLFFARAQRAVLDAQGRVRIAPELAELARLDKEVMLVGVQDHVEIWATDRWKAYLAERQDQYDALAEAAFE